MTQILGYNDGILLISLIYSSVDLSYEWDQFDRCQRPIHWWLLVSYASVIMFRTTHLLGTRTTDAGNTHFLLDLRQKGALPRLLVSFTWFVALPFFTIWTVVGTHWLVGIMRTTPSCVPTHSHLGFTILWLVLSYVWILIHAALGVMAWLLEYRLRRAEVDLRGIQDADMVSRWGEVSVLPGYRSLNSTDTGLTPTEINALPLLIAGTTSEGAFTEDTECSICLNDICPGESLRQLCVCGHSFHRACIDLWLLRRGDCPLCKRCVKAGCVPTARPIASGIVF